MSNQVNTASHPKAKNPFIEALNNLKKNKMACVGGVILLLFIIIAVFADFIAPHAADTQDWMHIMEGPSADFPLGTDSYGRCVFSRIVYGSRISLLVGFVAVAFSAIGGGIIGACAGYFRGRLDNTLMRIMDVLLAIPSILLAIAIVNILGPSLINVMIAVGLSSMPSFARIVRAAVLSIRDSEFIESAVAIGDSTAAIIWHNILPNCLAPIIVQATLGVASAILSAAGLSFLGLGLQPPSPEWGAMLSEGRAYIYVAPWLTICPGVSIVLVVLSLNLFGDGLRDALDPKLKQ